ncbi:DHH family phosphoesterase [Corynebacterium mayonis]|uniref:DHH family phosphoesterase n=1 Tax=Corynebacterium mayonis TaxID=3062461 RepID=UPI0031402B87
MESFVRHRPSPEGRLFPELSGTFAEIAARLRAASSVVVVAHIRPDADAVGSACSLAQALRKVGLDASVCIGQRFKHPDNLDGIPGVEEISYVTELPEADLVVTVDCASIDRTGAFAAPIAKRRDSVIVIDHHETNPGFGGVNLVTISESTTVLVRELISYLGVELDRDIAYCLYAGLVTDTGSFRWGTPRMHLLAAELIGFGLDTRQIALELMDEMDGEDLRRLGSVLAGVKWYTAGGYKVAVFTIEPELHVAMGQSAVESVIDYSRTLAGCDVGVVLKGQGPGRWSVSLRSSRIDVSQVAARLGGGGHVPAAGFSAGGLSDEVVEGILREIR